MSEWTSSKTHNFWRFQPKRRSPSFSAYFFTYYSTGQNRFSIFFRLWHFFDIRIIKRYSIDVLKAWDYARTIFQSEKLRIAYIKPETCTRKHDFWCFEDDCMVSMYHGIMAMYHGYVSWLCILAMYHGYVFYIYIYIIILCIIKNDSSESKKVFFWKML